MGRPIDKHELPNDIEVLKELIVAQSAAHATALAEKDEQLRHLQREYDILKRLAFGPKSDRHQTKHVPGQGWLFAAAILEEAERNADELGTQGEIEITPPDPKPKSKGRRRRKWPSDAPTLRTTTSFPRISAPARAVTHFMRLARMSIASSSDSS
ncbi:MAG: hypothetical protein AAF628_35800 [Planctomycetota bacterium]